MIFRRITHDDLGCASYRIGDEDAGVAAVVDPKPAVRAGFGTKLAWVADRNRYVVLVGRDDDDAAPRRVQILDVPDELTQERS